MRLIWLLVCPNLCHAPRLARAGELTTAFTRLAQLPRPVT